jgi:alanine racemase
MTPSHLLFQVGRDILRAEFPALFGQHQLERNMKQQVTQLAPDRVKVAVGQRMIQFQHLFDQIGPQRFTGLRLVPGAAHSKIPYHGHGTSQPRIVLHVILAPNIIPAGPPMTFSSETLRAWVDVNLAALVANARTVAAVSGSRLLPMVKANGYGLGAVPVARALRAIDPWGFGVASVEEAQALREAGISHPLLVATPLIPQLIERHLALELRPTIGDPGALEAWIAQTERPFHLEIDTGMSRAGVRWNDSTALEKIRSALAAAPGWEGAFTHFVSSESDPDLTALQWQRFQQTLGSLPHRPSLVHAANSAASLQGRCYAGDLVRPGIYLYGGAAGTAAPQPVAALRARVVALRSVEPGDTVGYGATWRADRPSMIATLAVGYADGFPRSMVENGHPRARYVELNGTLSPVVGRVTMDMCMVLVNTAVAIGDVGTIYGGLVSLDSQAELAGTVSYELLVRLGPRITRRYLPDTPQH